jgi:hypothetical protein
MNSFASSVPLPAQQPMAIGPAWGSASTGIQNLQNTFGGLGGSVLPQAQQTASNLSNNPYSGLFQTGANAAAPLGAAGATAGFNTGAGLTGAGMSLVPYAQNIMDTGFDPQSQLYARTAQQVADQARAGEAARGINMTPYGAGLENDAMRNFNIDWQNQQLGRQATAAGAAGSLEQAGAGVAGQGVGLMNQAPGQLVQSSMLPYATYSDIGQGQNQALMQLLGIGGAGQGLAQTGIQDWLSLLGVGNQANQVANQQAQLALNQNQQNWSQMMGLGSGLGSAISAAPKFISSLSSLFPAAAAA